MNSCQDCLLTFFCCSCQQAHPTPECAILQDIVGDGKVMVNLSRQTGQRSTVCFTQLPRKQHLPVSSVKDWYEYYTRLSDKGGLKAKMNRDLKYLASNPEERKFVEYMRCGTNTTTIQLTLLAALEASIPNISTRSSINVHIIGAGGAEFASTPAFEELLHLLPSLKDLQLTFVGLNVSEPPPNDPNFHNPHMLQCCTACTKMGRTISITTWRGPYHAYIDTDVFKTPDLAAAFQSGFSVDEQKDWYPTIKYLAHAPHPTLFTASRFYEIREEMAVWKNLGAEYVKDAEVNKWKGMTPSLCVCGDRPNEVLYTNYWWYIVKRGETERKKHMV